MAPALVALVVALSGCATTDRDDLRSRLEQVRSDAAEGALLAGEAQRGTAPVSFVWLHSAELHHHVQGIVETLDGTMVDEAIQARTQSVKLIADTVAGALDYLHRNTTDPHAAALVQSKLEQQASVATKLDEQLK